MNEIQGVMNPARRFGRRFCFTFPNELAVIARPIKSGATFRLVLVLPSHLNWSRFRRLSRDVLARELDRERDMEGPTVSRALVGLHRRGLSERKGNGPVTMWKLSPSWGRAGTPNAYRKAVREQTEAPKAEVVP